MARTPLGDVFSAVEGPRPRPGRKGGEDAAETLQLQRQRMISAVLHTVAEKGYLATTVTDIVTKAKVSRVTFYEHFGTKEDCFVAAYDAVQKATAIGINRGVSTRSDPVARLVTGVDAYLAGIFANPALSRVFYVDIYAAGPRALAMRRAATDQWAANIRRGLDAARLACEPLAAITQPLSQNAAVAAVHEEAHQRTADDLPAGDHRRRGGHHRRGHPPPRRDERPGQGCEEVSERLSSRHFTRLPAGAGQLKLSALAPGRAGTALADGDQATLVGEDHELDPRRQRVLREQA
jgi:AcrR family transcriptional regulator